MTFIKNENGEFWCGKMWGKDIWLASTTFAKKFPTDAEARKVLFCLKDKLKNDTLKMCRE